MSQNPNEQGYFTHLLSPNSSYQQEIGSNPSTPSSQHSQSSSSFQQYPGFGTRYSTAIPPPEHIFRQQQQVFFNHQLNNQFQNFQQQKNAPFQNLQKQPDAFQQSQPQPRFKEPQPQPPKDKCKKRVAKRATVDLVDENDEENEADHIKAAKITFAAQQPTGRKFQPEHCWRILKGHSKWDAPKPLDTEGHTEIFGRDVRPCPAGKN
ncbi:hypothetical protein Tco_1207507 [Tanacetum coccineum]